MIARAALGGLGLLHAVFASAYEFSGPVTVASAEGKVFYHLDSSGRQGMASNDGLLALVWEDNASGTPQVRVAFRNNGAAGFAEPVAVSDAASPAYEPVIAACGKGFVVGWEAGDTVWLRSVTPSGMGEPVAVVSSAARHLSLNETPDGRSVAAVWAERHGRFFQIAQGRVSGCDTELRVQHAGLVDRTPDKTDQLYPAVAVTKAGTVVAWEDRRSGSTRIYTAFAPTGQGFLRYRLLNEYAPSPNPKYGKGTGAMRVVLSTDQDRSVMAVWMDKRSFEGGYDVYAAFSHDGGRSFGKNELVQDEFGENIPQWHAAGVLVGKGRAVVAWDDTRDDTPDIWFSERDEDGEWSDDENWPGGAGKGAQTFPVLLLDEDGLHAAWQTREGNRSSIRYIRAQ